METTKTLTFYTPKLPSGNGAIFVDTGISAGFPSPVNDFSESRISLDDELIKNNPLYARLAALQFGLTET